VTNKLPQVGKPDEFMTSPGSKTDSETQPFFTTNPQISTKTTQKQFKMWQMYSTLSDFYSTKM